MKWVALEGHFDYHAKLVDRFREAGGDAVRHMWNSQTNEDGKPLSHFERKALVERHCELFGTWPDPRSIPEQHQELDARVGERIRSRREELGLTRTELAGMLVINQGVLEAIETGEVRPNPTLYRPTKEVTLGGFKFAVACDSSVAVQASDSGNGYDGAGNSNHNQAFK